jgi:alpha-N-acetylglucosaminidase
LIDAAPECGDSEGYRYDVADVGRQVLADLGTRYHHAIVQTFQSKNPERLRQLSDKMLGLIRDMDRLAGTRKEFLLGAWIADARAWGVTPEEKDLCEWNARSLLTVWSVPASNIYDVNKHVDYANRHWNGLLGQYYFSRWKLWLDALNEAVGKDGKFDPAPVQKRIQDAEFAWTRATDPLPAEPSGDPIAIAKELLSKYAAERFSAVKQEF